MLQKIIWYQMERIAFMYSLPHRLLLLDVPSFFMQLNLDRLLHTCLIFLDLINLLLKQASLLFFREVLFCLTSEEHLLAFLRIYEICDGSYDTCGGLSHIKYSSSIPS